MKNEILLSEPVCVAPTGDVCGEGPVWHPEEEALYWTDINRFLIHRYSPKDAAVKSWIFELPVTALVLTDREDTLAVALGSGVILWEPSKDRRSELRFRLPGWPGVRLNDGRADPRGSFWVGSMRNNVHADGSAGEVGGTDGILYRIDPDWSVTEWKKDIGIANTLVWSRDQRVFYFADTLANRICAYDYQKTTGSIGNERTFLAGFDRGSPDGSNIDSDDYVWNCRYGGKCIVRVGADGEVDRVIEMAVSNVTSCTFGGGDYKTLYVTTAAAAAPRGERLAGGLFTVQTTVSGLPENRFRVFGA